MIYVCMYVSVRVRELRAFLELVAFEPGKARNNLLNTSSPVVLLLERESQSHYASGRPRRLWTINVYYLLDNLFDRDLCSY